MKQYDVVGMSCAACSRRVEKAVAEVDGVSSCSVNLLTNSMSVEGEVSDEIIIAAVEKAGYGASVKGNEAKAENTDNNEEGFETRKIIGRLIFSIVMLSALMYISMGHNMFGFYLPEFLRRSPSATGLLQMILAASVMVANQKFFINGFKGAIHLAPNMDTLVTLGSISAFLYSVVLLFDMIISGASHLHGLYFESAAMVVTLITVGKMLEAKAKGRTTNALRGLMELAPKKATIIRNGKEVVINAEEVAVDDIFVLRPGESVPVDGIVEDGESTIDESALTGESLPVDKMAGQSVSAATINLSGYLKCRAKRVGRDTTLAQIIQVVSDASATKAPIAKIADKVSGVFVPIVIIIAVLTFGVWLLLGEGFGFALARAISVLVISCPCALGLATPVAIMVGSGIGARMGILFKTASALEITGKAKIIALDKTGTITAGAARVKDVLPCGEATKEELIEIAASLEKNSAHPLAKAINEYAEEKGILAREICEFKNISGNGLEAKLDGEYIFGGNMKLAGSIVMLDDDIKKKADELAVQGKTPMFFGKAGKLLGIISVADAIKDDSKKAIGELKKIGLSVVMITGDNAATAKAIAKESGIDEIFSDVMPNEKEKIISDLQKKSTVIMVGDGINDAPALTRADSGIAIGAGMDIAVDAADVVVIKSRLSDVVSAIKLSRSVIKNIYQNLFWAFGYNIIGIPLAAGALSYFNMTLSPMFAAAAMSISSIFVVSNALRLNLIKINK